MYNGDEEDPYFIVTHKEQEMLMQFRELSDEERKEVEKKLLEAALKHAKWGEWNRTVENKKTPLSCANRIKELPGEPVQM